MSACVYSMAGGWCVQECVGLCPEEVRVYVCSTAVCMGAECVRVSGAGVCECVQCGWVCVCTRVCKCVRIGVHVCVQ